MEEKLHSKPCPSEAAARQCLPNVRTQLSPLLSPKRHQKAWHAITPPKPQSCSLYGFEKPSRLRKVRASLLLSYFDVLLSVLWAVSLVVAFVSPYTHDSFSSHDTSAPRFIELSFPPCLFLLISPPKHYDEINAWAVSFSNHLCPLPSGLLLVYLVFICRFCDVRCF